MTLLQMFMVVGCPVLGMCYSVLGAIKLPLAERLALNEAKVGGLIAAFGFMVGPIILLSGFVADSLGRKGVWFTGAVLAAVALFMLARTTQYIWAAVAVGLLSAGWAAMINVTNVVMYIAYENVFMATNLLDFFFGLGAFLTPACVLLLIRKFGFAKGVSILGWAVIFPMMLAFAVRMDSTAPANPAGFGTLAGDPVMWLCALTLALWLPIESSTATWTTSFVNATAPIGEDPLRTRRISNGTLSAFWFCFMAGRLGAALVFHASEVDVAASVRTAKIAHLWLACAVIVLLVGLVFSRRRTATIALIVMAGLVFGPFFPTLIAILLSHFPPELHGRAIGLLFGTGSIGWTIIPALIGAVAARTSLQKGFLVTVGSSVALLVVLIIHHAYNG